MAHIPSAINLHKQSRVLEVVFAEECFQLPFEYLRVFSPSAEVRGHGNQPIKLVTGKENVQISHIEPAGQYALKITFDDGHDSGLYTWQTLYDLGYNQAKYWQEHLQRLAEHKARATVERFTPQAPK